MAMCSVPPVHQDLYNDMRAQFPELPDTVIQSYVQLYPRNRAECIEHLTRASQDQLYSQFDPEEELSINREGARLPASRVFELLEPPFPVDRDLPPPYPGVLTPVTPTTPTSPHSPHSLRTPHSPSPSLQQHHRSPQATQQTPPYFPPPRPGQPPARMDYRSQFPAGMSATSLYGPAWPQPGAIDSPMNRLHHSPPVLDDMIQALLTHQRQRFELLQRMYAQQMQLLQQLRTQVESKEVSLMSKQLADVTPSQLEELKTLQRRNRALNVECHCLLSEVDLYARGEVPVGATDDHFYQRLNPGQTVPQTVHHPVPPPSYRPILSPPRVFQSNTPSPRTNSILSEDEENQEDNRWKCSKCTFLNHPALEACELCEMPKAPSSDV
nr:mitogen-activated protein kinase kinase kinase 7-interacting protein 3 homolog [Rhipicephalus microplus]XP_037281154.1 mitogen-activated protein kinase kinase kinase 7-interacting protein 3 homolog [Rhipicephalus microplus]